jgi:hypothetical protein
MYDNCRDVIEAKYLTSARTDTPSGLSLFENIKIGLACNVEWVSCQYAFTNEDQYCGNFETEFRNIRPNSSYMHLS